MKCQRFIIDFKSYEWKYRMSIEAGKFTKIGQIKFLEKSKFSDFSASFYFEICLVLLQLGITETIDILVF